MSNYEQALANSNSIEIIDNKYEEEDFEKDDIETTTAVTHTYANTRDNKSKHGTQKLESSPASNLKDSPGSQKSAAIL